MRLPLIALTALVLSWSAPGSSALAASGPDPLPAAPATIRVLQHNTDHVPEAWDFAIARIREEAPHLATIQEVCRPWFDRLQASHPEWTMAYHPRKRHYGGAKNPGCGGDFIGEAVIWTGAPHRPTATPDYPNNNADGLERFGLACVEFRHRGIPTLGCSTHLSAYPTSGGRGTQPERGPQAEAIMRHTEAYRDAGWAVVLGGDLNMTSQPDNPNHAPVMNLLLGPAVGGTGAFYDASQHECGCRLTRPTTDKDNRIDYVLLAGTRTPWTSRTAMTYADSPAGHHLLLAEAPLRRHVPEGGSR